MHIAFLTSEYPHEKTTKSAGLGTSTKNLAVALAKKGIQVTVFVYSQKNDVILSSNGVTMHLLKHKKYSFLGWHLHRKSIQKYVSNVVEEEKINILEAPDWTGITAFMNFKVPLVIRFHGSDAYFCKLERRKQKAKNYWFEKIALKNATAYIAPTFFAGKETSRIFSLDEKKIKTIHYGLQLENFVNSTPNLYQENTLLYIGTIIRKKGVLELAEIFNKVIAHQPNANLILIGTDAYDIKTANPSTFSIVEELLTERAKSQTKYLGKIPYADVFEYIKKAHVCVFPSFAETLGMVTIESMAMQKPVVNTSIGWAQELIDDGVNGFLIHPSEIDAYAKKIIQLFEDKELCKRIGKAARQKVEEKFDIDKNAQENINYYKMILNDTTIS